MENVFVKLNPIEAATLVRLAGREHDRRQKRGKPARGYSPAAWAMELSDEARLLARLMGETTDAERAAGGGVPMEPVAAAPGGAAAQDPAATAFRAALGRQSVTPREAGHRARQAIVRARSRVVQIRGRRSRRQLARELGVTHALVSRFEAGGKLSIDLLLALGLRGVRLDWLVFGDGPAAATPRDKDGLFLDQAEAS